MEKKIIDLGILPENELSGVKKISLVEEPAIELDFLYFKKENFVYPSAGEGHDEFINRCMPFVINEGKEADQAYAMCEAYWSEKMAALKVSFDYHDTLNTAAGKELAKKAIAEGADVYVISAGQNIKEFMPLVEELGIDKSRVYATGSNKAKIEKIKELAIDKHYDNNADVIAELGNVGIKFELIGLDIFGYKPANFDICPVASALFKHLSTMIVTDDIVGMIRSAALQADKIFEIEKSVVAKGIASKDEVKQAVIFAGDFIDLMKEIDVLVGMQHDVSWVEGHIMTIYDYLPEEERFDIDTSGLTPYVDQVGTKKKIEDILSKEQLETILEMASVLGVHESEVDYVSAFQFALNPKDAEYTPARTITKADGEEVVYKYRSSNVAGNSRQFCTRMMGLSRFYTREEIDALDTFNEEFGPGVGGGRYSIFKYKGGVNCQHYWQKFIAQRVGRRLQVTEATPTDNIQQVAETAPRTTQGRGYVKRPERNLPPLAGHSAFSKLQFNFADEEQKVIVGPAMLPNISIPRKDEETGDIYYVKFSEETIKEIAQKYMKEARTNEVNTDHEVNDAGTYIFESWIVEDPKTDKANTVYGYDVPVGTWMVKMKIESPETWRRIKAGELRGLSVEGSFSDMEEIESRRKYDQIKKILK